MMLSLGFEEQGIEKDGSTNQQGLFSTGGIIRKLNVKGVGIRKDLDRGALWFLEDRCNVGCITVGVLLSHVVDAEG